MTDRFRSALFRFLKGAAAAAATTVIGYAAGFVQTLGFDQALASVLVGLILGLEKYTRWE